MKLTIKSGYTVETMAQNIIAVVNLANADQYSDGLRWYSEARSVAESLLGMMNSGIGTASPHWRGLDAAAGVIAALSPRTRWQANVDRAFALVSTGSCAGLPRSRDHALAIAHGAAPMDVLRGPKTRAFALAIESGGASGIAVVDTWAVRAATRGRFDDVSRARYADVAEAYAVAARRLGLAVHATQAIAWVVTRGGAE